MRAFFSKGACVIRGEIGFYKTFDGTGDRNSNVAGPVWWPVKMRLNGHSLMDWWTWVLYAYGSVCRNISQSFWCLATQFCMRARVIFCIARTLRWPQDGKPLSRCDSLRGDREGTQRFYNKLGVAIRHKKAVFYTLENPMIEKQYCCVRSRRPRCKNYWCEHQIAVFNYNKNRCFHLRQWSQYIQSDKFQVSWRGE